MAEWFIFSREKKISQVAERYSNQYAPYPGEAGWRRNMREKIPLLEKAKTADEINEIIGNDTWTRHLCDFCCDEKEYLICMFEDEQSVFHACNVCLNLMMLDLDQANKG